MQWPNVPLVLLAEGEAANANRARVQSRVPRFLALGEATPLELDAAPSEGTSGPRSFTMLAYTGGAMRPRGFMLPVVVDLSGLDVPSQSRPILMSHDSDKLLGHTTEIVTSGRNIRVKGVLSGPERHVTDVLQAAANGFPWQASIGASIEQLVYVDEGEKVQANGRTFTGPLYLVRKGRLNEISVVPLGGDDRTYTKVAAAAADQPTIDVVRQRGTSPEGNTMGFEQWLQARGFNRDELTEDQINVLRAAFDAEQQRPTNPPAAGSNPPPTSPPVQAGGTGNPPGHPPQNPPASPQQTLPTPGDLIASLRQQQAAEIRRCEEIRQICAQYNRPQIEVEANGQRVTVSLEAHAVEQGWDRDRTELEAMRRTRPAAAAIHVAGGHGVPWQQVLTAAAMQATRLPTAAYEGELTDQVLQAAHTRFRGTIGLQELFIEAAVANGYQGPRRMRGQGEVRSVLEAAYSTHDISGILSNIGNKHLMQAFSAVEQSWSEIAARRNVSDYKTHTTYRMTGDLKFLPLGNDGEIKHAEAGETSYTNQADVFARMLALTIKDIVNDDLGALLALPTRMGRGAAIALNEVFWKTFMDNAGFFSSGNNNYADGAGTALSIDALTQAELLFYDQTDEDGNPLGVAPEILLVPNALFVTATNLMASLEIRDTTANKKAPTDNPHAGKFRVVRSSYLSNSSLSGNSTKAWYLLANPAALAAIEVAFLNGVETPTIESADADFNTLGIQMRGHYSFGVAKQEPRAGVKMKGEA